MSEVTNPERTDEDTYGGMNDAMRSIRTVFTIAGQEFNLYWQSPIAYVVGAAWLLVSGLFFSITLSQLNQGGGQLGFAPEPDLVGVLESMAFLLMFISPALTMRLVSDEIRSGTHELLMTAPVRDWEVIVGKWLGAWGVFTVFILIMLVYPFILVWRGSPEQGQLITGYLGLWLWTGTITAIGVLASSITQYQLVAFMIGEAVALGLFLANAAGNLIRQPLINEILNELTFREHLYTSLIERALIDPVDIAYFVGLIAISLFLATQILSMRRWRA